MRYRNRFELATISLMGLIVACSDQPASLGPDAADFSGPSLASVQPTATGFQFTVDPAKNETFVSMGEHRIVFPAYSICDPSRSSYGPAEWDAPCEPLSAPITINADTMTVDGHPYLRFSPELRFVPSADPRQWVMLYMKDPSASDPLVGPTLQILWVAPDGSLIDETLTDPTLATRVQGESSIIYRRVKHFSGFLVSAGRVEAEAPELQ
jgi:hypothetical protein